MHSVLGTLCRQEFYYSLALRNLVSNRCLLGSPRGHISSCGLVPAKHFFIQLVWRAHILLSDRIFCFQLARWGWGLWFSSLSSQQSSFQVSSEDLGPWQSAGVFMTWPLGMCSLCAVTSLEALLCREGPHLAGKSTGHSGHCLLPKTPTGRLIKEAP